MFRTTQDPGEAQRRQKRKRRDRGKVTQGRVAPVCLRTGAFTIGVKLLVSSAVLPKGPLLTSFSSLSQKSVTHMISICPQCRNKESVQFNIWAVGHGRESIMWPGRSLRGTIPVGSGTEGQKRMLAERTPSKMRKAGMDSGFLSIWD